MVVAGFVYGGNNEVTGQEQAETPPTERKPLRGSWSKVSVEIRGTSR